MFPKVIVVKTDDNPYEIPNLGCVYVKSSALAEHPHVGVSVDSISGYCFVVPSYVTSCLADLDVPIEQVFDLEKKNIWPVGDVSLKFEEPILNPFAHYNKEQYEQMSNRLYSLCCSDGDKDFVLYLPVKEYQENKSIGEPEESPDDIEDLRRHFSQNGGEPKQSYCVVKSKFNTSDGKEPRFIKYSSGYEWLVATLDEMTEVSGLETPLDIRTFEFV